MTWKEFKMLFEKQSNEEKKSKLEDYRSNEDETDTDILWKCFDLHKNLWELDDLNAFLGIEE